MVTLNILRAVKAQLSSLKEKIRICHRWRSGWRDLSFMNRNSDQQPASDEATTGSEKAVDTEKKKKKNKGQHEEPKDKEFTVMDIARYIKQQGHQVRGGYLDDFECEREWKLCERKGTGDDDKARQCHRSFGPNSEPKPHTCSSHPITSHSP